MSTPSTAAALRVLLCASLCGAAACSTADLRPDALARAGRPDDATVQRGRALLDAAAQAHHLDAWRGKPFTRLVLRDHWPHWLTRTAAMPWDESGDRMQLTIQTGTDTSRLDFLSGEWKGTAWGIQQWVTYTVGRKTRPQLKRHEDAWFWLPTIEYFFELPWRIREATEVTYLGPRQRGGKTYDRVFATWGGYQLSETIDQYVIWIARDTGRVELAEFTARDVYGWVTGVVVYEGYHEVDGVIVPKTITIYEGLDADVLHRMALESVTFPKTVEWPLVIDPARRAAKSARGG